MSELALSFEQQSHCCSPFVASPSTPSIPTRGVSANASHPSVLSRHRSSSATNPSGITSPRSPSNVNFNDIEQSMSPPSTSQSMPNTATRTNSLTATKIESEIPMDTSIPVRFYLSKSFSLYSSSFSLANVKSIRLMI